MARTRSFGSRTRTNDSSVDGADELVDGGRGGDSMNEGKTETVKRTTVKRVQSSGAKGQNGHVSTTSSSPSRVVKTKQSKLSFTGSTLSLSQAASTLETTPPDATAPIAAPIPAPAPAPAPALAPASTPAPTFPTPSKYAHLKPLTDILEPGLIGIFVGFNPGIATATAGHAYAHPSNHFWRLLHASRLTGTRLCRPVEDVHLPRRYGLGNTNIVARPSRDIGELARGEMAAGTPGLEAKVARFRPESVCIVGKGIWEGIWQWRYERKMRKAEFRYGWQDRRHNMGKGVEGNGGEEEGEGGGIVGEGIGGEWDGARVFVATSTSGLSTIPSYPEKVEIWKEYGDWVCERRAARVKEGHVFEE